METIVKRAAGLDVHKAQVTASVRVPGPRHDESERRNLTRLRPMRSYTKPRECAQRLEVVDRSDLIRT